MSDVDYIKGWLDTEWAPSDRLIVAVDPGASGAIAWLDTGTHDHNRAAVVDMPIIKVKTSTGNKSELDHAAVAAMFNLVGDSSWESRVELVMEKPLSLGGFGEQCPVCKKPKVQGTEYNGLRKGLAAGGFPMIAALYGWRYAEYHPLTWKRVMQLTSDKELSRMTARRVFPGCCDRLDRKKDEGRAEALMLAEFHARKISAVGVVV